ncbi:hypothetical protein QEN19_000525 [Hanseniaspora menglaensis]
MSVLNYIRSFFAIDALDTRLKPKIDTHASKAMPSKWKSLEFRVYVLICIIIIPHMFYTTIQATSEANINYYSFERLLSKGWIHGRKVDNSDQQYKFFRDNLMLLSVVLTGHIFLKKFVVNYLLSGRKLLFDFGFGFIFLFVLHGVNMLKILFLIGVIHVASVMCIKQKYFKSGRVIVFFLGVATLFFNVNFRKWRYEQILFLLKPLDSAYKGIVSRWDVFYNFMLLRIISFEIDFMEISEIVINKKKNEAAIELIPASVSQPQTSLKDVSDKTQPDAIAPTDIERICFRHDIKEYNIVNMFAYLLYAPLLIAGPIITFNDFIYQSRSPLKTDSKFKLRYLFRLIFCILIMEILLHYTYVVALSKIKAWDGLSPYQISMIGLFNLNLIWLKLLIPWRFFRFWSLLDEIDPPENMLRCMNNNFSALKFWRSWHRSFNKWVIRYIYIPLGGGSNRIIGSLSVFTFVAIWHDIELKLLLWGWMIVLFLIPEIFLSKISYKYLHNRPTLYRFVSGIGCVANIWMMMIANIFGFCLGEDGTKKFLTDLVYTKNGLTFFIISNVCLFIGVHVMFEIREDERRRNIESKC